MYHASLSQLPGAPGHRLTAAGHSPLGVSALADRPPIAHMVSGLLSASQCSGKLSLRHGRRRRRLPVSSSTVIVAHRSAHAATAS